MSNVLKGQDQIFQIAKLMTMKDQLQGQIFFAVMYRKKILWDDLDLCTSGKEGEDVYASPKVVEVSEKMNDYVAEMGYKPTKMIFEPISDSKPGLYTKPSDCKPETAETFKDMISGVVEMENLINQLYLFSEDKKLI